jgi:outer membrane protein TolC
MYLKSSFKSIILFNMLLILMMSAGSPVQSQEFDLFSPKEPIKLNLQQRQLTMEDAIKMALLNNPRVAIEQSLIEYKKWDIKENKSYLFPNLYFSEEFMTSNNPVNAFMMKLHQRNLVFNPATINKPGAVSNFQTRVGGSWVILDRSIYKKIDISKLELEIQKHKGKEEIIDLVYDVRKAYLDIKLSQESVNNAQENFEQAQSHLEAVSHKKEVGIASKSDYLSAKVNYASAMEALAKARNDLNLAWIVLSDIVGDESVVGYDLVDTMNESIPADDIDKLVKYAYLHRPEIIAVEKNKDKAVIDLKLAKTTGALTLKAYGEWGVDTIFDDAAIAKSFTAGAVINKSLFDGGLKKAKVKKAEANIDKANAKIEQIYSNVKVEVVQNYLGLKNAEERLKMTEDLVANAKESLRTYNERYEVGLSTNVEVETAQANLAKSQLLRTHALHDLNKAMIEIQKSIGMPVTDIVAGRGLLVTSQMPYGDEEIEFEITEMEEYNPEQKVPIPDTVSADETNEGKVQQEVEIEFDSTSESEYDKAQKDETNVETIEVDLLNSDFRDIISGEVDLNHSGDEAVEITPEDAEKINIPYGKDIDNESFDLKKPTTAPVLEQNQSIEKDEKQLKTCNKLNINQKRSLEQLSKSIIKG